jgi:hypothetical protein
LISSTATLSDEALSISIKTFLLHNLDNIFASSLQGKDRIKSCYKYSQSETVPFVENCEIIRGNGILGILNILGNPARDQARSIDLKTVLE